MAATPWIIFLGFVAVLLFDAPVGATGRNYTTEFCNTTKLMNKFNGLKGTDYNTVAAKALTNSALRRWNATGAAKMDFLMKNIHENGKVSKLPKLNTTMFPLVPTICLGNVPATNITKEQILSLTETSLNDLLPYIVQNLSVTDQTAILKGQKTMAMKQLVAQSVAPEILKTSAKEGWFDCDFFIGAFANPGLTKAQFDAVMTEFVKKTTCKLDADSVSKMGDNLVRLMKDVSGTDKVVGITKPFLPYVSRSVCEKLFDAKRVEVCIKTGTDAQQRANLIALKLHEVSWNTDPCMFNDPGTNACGRYWMEHIEANPKVQVATVYNSLGSLVAYGSQLVLKSIQAEVEAKKQPCETLKLYKLTEVAGDNLATALKKKVVSCVSEKPLSDISNWATVTKADMQKESYVGYLPYYDTDKIDKLDKVTVLCDPAVIAKWPKILNPQMLRVFAKCTIDLLKSPRSLVECSKMPMLRVGLPAITALGAGILSTNLKSEVGRQFYGRLIRAEQLSIVKKGTTSDTDNTLKAVLTEPALARWIECAEIKSKTKTAFINTLDPKATQLTLAQSLCMFEELHRQNKGEWTLDKLKKFPLLIGPGLTGKVLRNTTIDPIDLLTILSPPDIVSKLPADSVDYLTELLVGYLASQNASKPFGALTKGYVEKYQALLTLYKKPEDIANDSPADVCKAYCSLFDALYSVPPLFCRPMPHLNKVYSSCKKCMKGNTNKYTSAEFIKMGALGALLSKDELNAMDDAEFKKIAYLFGRSYSVAKDVADAFVTKAKLPAVFDAPDKWTLPTLVKLGNMLKYFSDADLMKVTALMADATVVVSTPDDHPWPCLKKLYKDRAKYDEMSLMRLANASRLSLIGPSSSSRKKRSTATATTKTFSCDEIQMLPPAARVTMQDKELKAIAKADFVFCSREFGEVGHMFPKAKRDLIFEKVKNDTNTPDKLTASQLLEIGQIILSVSTTDIKSLKLADEGIVAVIGAQNNYTKDQMEALGKRYVETHANLDMSTMTPTTLAALGSIICGLNTTEIEKLKPESLKAVLPGSQDVFGSCSIDKLKSLLKVSKNAKANGPIEDWGEGEVVEEGMIVAAFDKDDMKKAGMKLGKVDTKVFEKMPPEVLKELPKEVYDALPQDAKDVVDAAKDVDSASGSPYVMKIVILICVALTTWVMH